MDNMNEHRKKARRENVELGSITSQETIGHHEEIQEKTYGHKSQVNDANRHQEHAPKDDIQRQHLRRKCDYLRWTAKYA